MDMRQVMPRLIGTLYVGILLSSVCAYGDTVSPVGRWTAFDEETGRAEAIIEIKRQGPALYGWIDEILGKRRDAESARCTQCVGKLKNAPMLGLKIIQNMRRQGDEWRGHIMDPQSGKVYNATLSLADEGQSLDVRGYIGVPLFGRTQTWQRME
jgi:uncharacterized protein (DUF2147 family)